MTMDWIKGWVCGALMMGMVVLAAEWWKPTDPYDQCMADVHVAQFGANRLTM